VSMDASYEYAQYNATSERNKLRKVRYLIFPKTLDLAGMVFKIRKYFLSF